MSDHNRLIVLVTALIWTISGRVLAQAAGQGSVVSNNRPLPFDSTLRMSPLPYASGTAIRMHTADGAVLQGVFAGSGRDTVFLRLDAGHVTAVPAALVKTLEYMFTEDQRRRRRYWGLATGAGLGLVTGIIAGANYNVPECKSLSGCQLDTPTGYIVAFGIVGASLGALVGHQIAHSASSEWQTHPVQRVAYSPKIRGNSGVGMTVSIHVPSSSPFPVAWDPRLLEHEGVPALRHHLMRDSSRPYRIATFDRAHRVDQE